MKRNWLLGPRAEPPAAASQTGVHPIIAAILHKRGVSEPAQIARFLNPSLDSLEDPFAFRDMDKAVTRIRAAISDGERILVYGDYDVDGVTGSAILYPILKKAGADAEVHIPHRIQEGYGLNLESLARWAKKKIGLVITVDNGITGVEEVRFLAEKGIDTIIVDHHLPKGSMPPACAIISSEAGGQGDSNLAACGLAFKLGWALLGGFEEVREYLDLVTIGTVADLAPVLGDNRVLLKHGLSSLAQSRRIGLRALMGAARIHAAKVSYRDIAFALGPRINASGRMGSPENAFRLLTTDNALLAENLAQLLDEGNRDRQRAESAAVEEAVERVEREFMSEADKVLVVESPDWHEGVLGIVAARLVERYHKPALVLSCKNGSAKGSGRSTPDFSIFDCVSSCEEFLSAFGGHAQACGLTIAEEKILFFRKKLNEEAVKMRLGLNGTPKLDIEAELPLGELSTKFLSDLDSLAPFGPGNRKPLFVSKNVRLKGVLKKRGQDTLCGWVTDEAGRMTCEMVGFRMFGRAAADMQAGRSFHIVHQPVIKHFNGIPSIQLELEDWEPAA